MRIDNTNPVYESMIRILNTHAKYEAMTRVLNTDPEYESLVRPTFTFVRPNSGRICARAHNGSADWPFGVNSYVPVVRRHAQAKLHNMQV